MIAHGDGPRRGPQMSAIPDSTLADAEQIIADLRRQLAECRAERDEALQRETATAEILQVINSSPGDRTPVFEAILEKARILCGAVHGSLSLYDGERFRAVAINTRSPELAERMRQGFLPSDFPSLMPLLDGARLVHVPDLAEIGNPYGARTGLFVPLRKDDGLLGLISTVRLEIRPFSDKEIAFVENFAAQAVIAMENARLLGELQARTRDLEESLEYQTATSDVLKVISRSTADVQPVLDTVVETAARLCGADTGNIAIREGEVYRIVASSFSAAEPEFWAIQRQRRFVPSRDSITGRVALEGRVVHVEDIAADPDYAHPETVKAGIRTNLGVPLLREGAVLGSINLGRKRVEPFTERQIELVRTFADQAVIAIENARLLTETREALEQQTAIAELLQVINASPGDLAPVFDAMMERATRLCDAAFGALSIVTEEGYINHRSYSGPSEIVEFFKRRPVNQPGSGTTMDRLVRGESCVHVPDLTATDAYRNGDPVRRAMVDTAGARTLISVALRKEDALLGALTAYRQEVRPFTDKQIALLQNFAAQAVIAMENARLLTETREALDQRTATAEVLQVINSSPGDLTPVFDA